MKRMIRNLGSFALVSAMLFATNALAQSTTKETTTTTTTSSGTLSEYGPNSIVVKTTTSSDPLSYSYTKTTTYVDQDGKPVSIETVKTGSPVTIYYDKDGTKMVATKVVVTRTTPAR